MSTELRRRRGSSAQHATFTGAQGEITVDLTNESVVVHDGVTPGGKRGATISDFVKFSVSGFIEGLNTGYATPYRIANPANYGDIGSYAVDLSYSDAASSTRGATGDNSTAIGKQTTASGLYSTAAGFITVASGVSSTAIGNATSASGTQSVAIGNASTASGLVSLATGFVTAATGDYTASFGERCEVGLDYHIGFGYSAIAPTLDGTNQNLTVAFDYQNGNGYFDGVADLGPADYAEYFETADGLAIEPGYFASFDVGSNKIVPGNTDIVGIVSAAPAVVGDTASLHWQDKYLRDEFDRYVWHDVEVTNANGSIEIMSDKILNPDYDPSIPYIPRSERPEWVPIGLLGKLWVRTDDATIAVGDRIDAGIDGKAIKGTGWRVIGVRDGLVRVLYK